MIDDSSVAWVYLGVSALASILMFVPLVLFLRDVKRSGRGLRAASMTFAGSFLLFLVPGIVLVVGVLVALLAADASLDVLQPANAIMMFVVITLAYRRTSRRLRPSAQ